MPGWVLHSVLYIHVIKESIFKMFTVLCKLGTDWYGIWKADIFLVSESWSQKITYTLAKYFKP